MAAKSFKQMVSTKEIRRADAYKVRLEDLHEEPGLNWRRYTDAFHKSVEELAELIAGGMEVDPLEVRPREEGRRLDRYRSPPHKSLAPARPRRAPPARSEDRRIPRQRSSFEGKGQAPAPGARKHQSGPVRTDPSRLRRRLSPDA